jgi:hypothetical protein
MKTCFKTAEDALYRLRHMQGTAELIRRCRPEYDLLLLLFLDIKKFKPLSGKRGVTVVIRAV